MKHRWIGLWITAVLLAVFGVALAGGAVAVPDTAACFPDATITQDHIIVEGLLTGNAEFVLGVTDAQITAYGNLAAQLGFSRVNTVQGGDWSADLLQSGDAHIALVRYSSASPQRVVILYEDGFTFSPTAASAASDDPLASFGAQSGAAADSVTLTVDGQQQVLPLVQGTVVERTGGTLTSRSTATYPGLSSGVALDGDLLYLRYTDGQDELILYFPAQVKAGSVVDEGTGRMAMVYYNCQSALAAQDRGTFYARTSGSRDARTPALLPLDSSFSITVSQRDTASKTLAGSFVSELGGMDGVSVKSISGDFSATLQ